jgi:hypothetical protein
MVVRTATIDGSLEHLLCQEYCGNVSGSGGDEIDTG